MMIKHGDLQPIIVVDGAELDSEETKKKIEVAAKKLEKKEQDKTELKN